MTLKNPLFSITCEIFFVAHIQGWHFLAGVKGSLTMLKLSFRVDEVYKLAHADYMEILVLDKLERNPLCVQVYAPWTSIVW